MLIWTKHDPAFQTIRTFTPGTCYQVSGIRWDLAHSIRFLSTRYPLPGHKYMDRVLRTRYLLKYLVKVTDMRPLVPEAQYPIHGAR